jgi:ketosteroid isomerase-like protein
MPTPAQVREAIERHVRFWNEGNKDQWLANFAPDCVVEDPVGTLEKSVSLASWDVSHTETGECLWTIRVERLIVSGPEALCWLHTEGTIDGRTYDMEYAGNWTVGDDGRITRARIFIEIPESDLRAQPEYQEYEEGRL